MRELPSGGGGPEIDRQPIKRGRGRPAAENPDDKRSEIFLCACRPQSGKICEAQRRAYWLGLPCVDGSLVGEFHQQGESFRFDGEESGTYRLTNGFYVWDADKVSGRPELSETLFDLAALIL